MYYYLCDFYVQPLLKKVLELMCFFSYGRCISTIIDKNVWTPTKYSLLPTCNVDNQVFFLSFLMEKT